MTLHRTISDFTDNKSIWNWYINSVGRLNLSQWRPCVCAVYVTWHFPLGWVDDWWMVFFLPMTIVAISQWHATAPQWMGGRDRCRTYYYQAPVRHGPKKLCDLGCGVFYIFKTKIIFEIQQGILEGCINRARPSKPSLKNCQNDTF